MIFYRSLKKMFNFIINVLLFSTYVCFCKSRPVHQSKESEENLSKSVNDYFYSDVIQQIFAGYNYGKETCLPLTKETCKTKTIMNFYGVFCDYCVIPEGESCRDINAMSPPCDDGLFCLPTKLSIISVEKDLTELLNMTCQRSNSFVKVVRSLPKNEVDFLLSKSKSL